MKILFFVSLLILNFTLVKSYARPSVDLIDGLALLVFENADGTVQAFGQGFIVDNVLISSAHVVVENPDRVFVTQNGRLIEITDKVEPGIFVDSKYRASDEILLPGIEAGRHPETQIQRLRKLARMPYDLGFLQIKVPLKTSFVLPASGTVEEYMAYRSSAKITDNSEVKISLEMDFNKSLPEALKSFKITKDPLLDGPRAGRIAFHPEVQMQSFQISSDPNVFVYGKGISSPGDSGSPLVEILPSGKLSILGVTSGAGNLSDNKDSVQTYFATQMKLRNLVNKFHAATAEKKSCSLFLGSN